jgi:NADH-quinone oxidoreductase subunit H
MFLQVLFFTTCERKILALTQRRIGPRVVGDRGRLQYFADALKLITKTYTSPRNVNSLFFQGTAIAVFWLSWFNFSNLTFCSGEDILEVEYNIFFAICCSLGFSIAWLVAGWASVSKYAMLGCIRAAIQIISYELITSAIFLNLFIITGTTNFELFIDQQEYFPIMLFFPLLGVMNFIAALVETNRPPFDLSEAESDLVAGYNVEYAGILFGLFYLSEYVNLFTNAFIIVIIFFGAWWNVLNYLDNLINVIFYCFFTNNFLIEYTKIFNFSANTLYLNLIEVGRVQYWNNIHSGMMISFIRGMFGITYDGAYWSTSITFPIPLKTDSLDLDSINWNIFKEAELVGITLDITSVFNSIIPNQISDRDLLHYNTYIGGVEMWSYITDIDRSNLLIEVYDIEEVSTPDVQEPSQPRFIEYDLRYFLF